MLVKLQGHEMYVVEFEQMPELPITWNTEEEKPYAAALAHAIQNGTIKKPGKYAISVDGDRFEIFGVIE